MECPVYFRNNIKHFIPFKNHCGQAPCKNKAICQSGFTSKGYRCLCKPGFTGPLCENGEKWISINIST